MYQIYFQIYFIFFKETLIKKYLLKINFNLV